MLRPYATVIASVDANGRVTNVRLDDSSGNDDYDAKALLSMQSWDFVPAASGCKAVASTIEFAVSGGTITFKDPCEHDADFASVVDPDDPPEHMFGPQDHKRDIAVKVSLDAVGRVRGIELARSSGRVDEDQLVLRAARQSTYFPPVHKCTPSAGTLLYEWSIDSPF